MLDRGLARGVPAAVELEAEEAAAAAPAQAGRPPRPDRPADLHDRSRDAHATSTTPSRPSADGDGMRVWVHIADVSGVRATGSARSTPRRYRRGNSVYVPGAVEPMLPEALSNRGLQPRAGGRAPGRDGRDGAATARTCAPRPSTAALIRCDARLDLRARSTTSSPARERAAEPWAEPLAAARGRRQGAARARASSAARSRSRPPSREFEFDERRPRGGRAP